MKVLVASAGTPSALAAKTATASLPIIFITGNDPVKLGLVASLNRPGGNIAGVTVISLEVTGKRLELLREMIPTAAIVALLVNPTSSYSEPEIREAQEASRTLGLRLHVLEASSERDIDAAFDVYRALAHWMLGYPATALADADDALEHARESGHAGTLMYAQLHTSFTNILCAKYAAANAQSNEVVRLADEKGAALWKALGTMQKGCVLALSGKASEAIQMITSGITTYQSTGSRVYLPFFLSHLSGAHAGLGQFDEA